MAGITVFVSVGRTSTPEQEEFVSAIETHMVARGLVPQAVGRNYWSSQQPLRAIDELMSQCSGVAIVGFERLRVVQAIDRRGSDNERQMNDFALPTVWNQVEAAMAYARGLPLLVLMQEELRAEGLLEAGYDWYVKRMRLGAACTNDREFCGVFDDWRARVESHHAGRQPPAAADRKIGSSPTKEAQADAKRPSDRRRLRMTLESRFSEDELRGLCFDLGVEYEDLPGASKPAKVIAVIGYFERMHRADELMRSVRELRPDEF
jgi:hypothetical protein